MGSLVVKLDRPTQEKLKNIRFYSDVDMLQSKNPSDNEIPISYDMEAVRISIRNILMWRVGESIIRPEFGHNLHKSMYSQLNQFNQEAVCSEIKRAIEENEPRVEIQTVSARKVEDDMGDTNALQVKVLFKVISDRTSDITGVEEVTITGK